MSNATMIMELEFRIEDALANDAPLSEIKPMRDELILLQKEFDKESKPLTVSNYGDEMTAQEIVDDILHDVRNSQELWEAIERSPEPKRFMVYESGAIENPTELNSEMYKEIIAILTKEYFE